MVVCLALLLWTTIAFGMNEVVTIRRSYDLFPTYTHNIRAETLKYAFTHLAVANENGRLARM